MIVDVLIAGGRTALPPPSSCAGSASARSSWSTANSRRAGFPGIARTPATACGTCTG